MSWLTGIIWIVALLCIWVVHRMTRKDNGGKSLDSLFFLVLLVMAFGDMLKRPQENHHVDR